MAPELSVGMGWHSGRAVRVDTHQETLLSNRGQTSFGTEDDLCVCAPREAFVCALKLMAHLLHELMEMCRCYGNSVAICPNV